MHPQLRDAFLCMLDSPIAAKEQGRVPGLLPLLVWNGHPCPVSFRDPCTCPVCQRGAEDRTHAHHNQLRALLEHLDERQRRWVAGLEAFRLGHGGEVLVAAITGLDRKTVRRGRREVVANFEGVDDERTRRPGAGGKSTQKKSLKPSKP